MLVQIQFRVRIKMLYAVLTHFDAILARDARKTGETLFRAGRAGQGQWGRVEVCVCAATVVCGHLN